MADLEKWLAELDDISPEDAADWWFDKVTFKRNRRRHYRAQLIALIIEERERGAKSAAPPRGEHD